MDLGLTDEQHQLVASFKSLLGKESSPERVRAAEPSGHNDSLWASLHDTGVLAMAVPERSDGWGASTVDLALVAQLVGRFLAPAPVIETQVAARLLATSGEAGAQLLAQMLAGERIVTLALHPVGAPSALVPAGAVAHTCLFLDDERLVAMDLDDARRTPVANLGSLPLADVDLTGAGTQLATGPSARASYDAAIDLWLVLTAAALGGIGHEAHRQTCEYATERHAWGVPIGTFQGVAHPLADSRTALDGATLLARKAAWAIDVGDPRARELAAMAFAFASETARDATYQAVHFHGGYGFMLETDVQLFYRRARAWARVWGEPASGYCRAGDARYTDARDPDARRTVAAGD